jgi:hypothetical protein
LNRTNKLKMKFKLLFITIFYGGILNSQGFFSTTTAFTDYKYDYGKNIGVYVGLEFMDDTRVKGGLIYTIYDTKNEEPVVHKRKYLSSWNFSSSWSQTSLFSYINIGKYQDNNIKNSLNLGLNINKGIWAGIIPLGVSLSPYLYSGEIKNINFSYSLGLSAHNLTIETKELFNKNYKPNISINILVPLYFQNKTNKYKLNPDGTFSDPLDAKKQCTTFLGIFKIKCPKEEGELDDDNDGFINKLDVCPTIKGTYKGCPDYDNDEVMDSEDLCPTEFGTKENKGCPKK